MKKKHSLTYLIIAFIIAQFAWMGLLGLWIYWYVANYLIIEQVGDKLAPQIEIDNPNVLIFVGGIILIVGIAIIMFFIFRNFSVQFKLTGLYDNFIANITHELKSPLSSIQLYLETMQSKKIPDQKKSEFFELMLRDTKRLNKLINTILELSRLEQKKIAHDFHIYNTDKIIRKLVINSAGHHRLSEDSIQISGSANRNCVIDAEAMQIVFDNLTDNAIKYSSNPVDISVILSSTPTKIILEFTDKGVGIPGGYHKKVFNKFQRIENKNSPNVKGTGLGLYWVKEIIKLHGGRVTLSSEGLNKGTTFRIELPVYKSSKKLYINSLLRSTAKKQKMMETENEE